MSDYTRGISISLDQATRYWKIVLYVLLFNIVVMKITNPLFKIVLAAYVGIQSILGITYAPIIYYKQIKDADSSNYGIVPKITGFVPNIMYKISTLTIKLLLKLIKHEGKSVNLNIDMCAVVMTHCLIHFRKLLSLACGILITAEDDKSAHAKALAIYTIFTLIQMKFITNTDLAPNAKPGKKHQLPLRHSLNTIIKLQLSKVTQFDYISLRCVRQKIFYVTTALVTFFMYHTYENISESLDTKFVWVSLLKCVILVDSLFASSLMIELGGLNLNVVNKRNTIV